MRMSKQDTEIELRYQAGDTFKADNKAVRLRRAGKGIEINRMGVTECGGYVSIYSCPDIDTAGRFFKLFFAPNQLMSGDRTRYVFPYILETEGVTHLIVSREDFIKLYKPKLHVIMKTVLRYMDYDTVKKTIFDFYTHFVYTWHGHYHKDKVMKGLSVDDLHVAVLHYSQPEKLNIVDTRRNDNGEASEEERQEGETLRTKTLKKYKDDQHAKIEATKAKRAKRRQA